MARAKRGRASKISEFSRPTDHSLGLLEAMPRKLRFDEEGQAAPVAAPLAAAPPAPQPPPLAVDDTASTSTASPSTTTAAGSKAKRTSAQAANGDGTPKKRKLVVFDEEAEEEAAKLRALGDAATPANGTPKRRAVWNAEQKRKAKDEAIRLMPGRKALPVYAGESGRPSLSHF